MPQSCSPRARPESFTANLKSRCVLVSLGCMQEGKLPPTRLGYLRNAIHSGGKVVAYHGFFINPTTARLASFPSRFEMRDIVATFRRRTNQQLLREAIARLPVTPARAAS